MSDGGRPAAEVWLQFKHYSNLFSQTFYNIIPVIEKAQIFYLD